MYLRVRGMTRVFNSLRELQNKTSRVSARVINARNAEVVKKAYV